VDEVQDRFGDEWGDKWAESWLRKEGFEYQENRQTKSYIAYLNGFEVRFTNEKVFITLRDFRDRASRVNRLKQRLMVEAADAVEEVEEVCDPVELKSKYGKPMFQVNQQHLAIVEDPFAELVVECDDADLPDFRVYDEEGNLRMWIDDSEGERHLETGTPSFWAEDDLSFIRDEVYRRAILHKDAWRALMDLVESGFDVSRLPELVSGLRVEVGALREGVNSVEDAVDTLQQDVESVERQMVQLDGKLDGVSEGLQQNREWISDVEERVDSTVRRVDGTRREFSQLRDDVNEDIESLQKKMGEEVESTRQLVREEVGGVESELESVEDELTTVRGTVTDLTLTTSELLSTIEKRGEKMDGKLEAILEEQRRMRRLQERTWVDKARDAVKELAEAGGSVVKSAREALSSVF